MIQDYNFHCPHCNSTLNDGKNIVLKTKRTNGEVGEIKMATSLGNYSYIHTPDVLFEQGEVVDFICTSCNESVNSKEFDSYALLKMRVDENIVFDVLFSRVTGIHKTYLVTEDGIESYSGN